MLDSETELREAIANTIRWHMRCDNESPGQYVGLCIANVENKVQALIDARLEAAAEAIEALNVSARGPQATRNLCGKVVRGLRGAL